MRKPFRVYGYTPKISKPRTAWWIFIPAGIISGAIIFLIKEFVLNGH